MANYASGQIVTTSISGSELVQIDTGGAVIVSTTAQTIANLGSTAGAGTSTASLLGTEVVNITTTGSVAENVTVQIIANLADSGGTTTATIVGTETMGLQTAAGVQEKATLVAINYVTPSSTASFTTAAQTNSTSVTLSANFTALTYTQTSTGNTVHLKAAPVNGEIQGFSMTNIVTNLTVSAAANTVLNGAVGTTVAGQALWWRFNTSDTSWYKYN